MHVAVHGGAGSPSTEPADRQRALAGAVADAEAAATPLEASAGPFGRWNVTQPSTPASAGPSRATASSALIRITVVSDRYRRPPGGLITGKQLQ